MIYSVIKCIYDHLNNYINSIYDVNEELITIANLAGNDNNYDIGVQNKIVLSLINIERETSMGLSFGMQDVSSDYYKKSNPGFNFNLYVLITALFPEKNYPEALKYLSSVLDFIQNYTVFDRSNTPQMDKRISKISLEPVTVDLQYLSFVWGMMGGKYQPSFLVKARMLTFSQSEIKGIVRGLKDPNLNIK